MSTTHRYRIEIEVSTEFIGEQAQPGDAQYVFTYHITIRNTGTVSAQLISRHWIITDDNGKIQEVRGQGVIGEQPTLAPGESFNYTSSCILPTTIGTMQGSYQMQAADGHQFDAPIPPFVLSTPRVLH